MLCADENFFPWIDICAIQINKYYYYYYYYSQTTNKLVNKAADDSALVSVQDRKKPPALGTNQIAGFGGFRPLASFIRKKIKNFTFLC